MTLAGLRKKLDLGDVLGALSIAVLMVPEAIAYSAIAGVPAAFGLTAAIAGPLAYAVLGRSRLAVVSATSGAAALLAAAIANTALPDVARIDAALALTLLVGLFFVVGAALRISTLASFVSRAVLHGFGLGLAITICIRQLPALLGVSTSGNALWQIAWSVLTKLGEVHVPSALVGLGSLMLLDLARRFRFGGAGFLLIAATVILVSTGPATHYGIKLAGQTDLRWAMPHLPRLDSSDWARLGQVAIPLSIVVLAESWATIRSLAAAAGEEVDPRREIAALGVANLVSGVFRGLPVGAGFSLGNANQQAGSRSRIASIIAAVLVALLAIAGERWIALVPDPVLAAIVIAALAHALSLAPIRRLFKLGKDGWIAVVAAVGVLVLGIVNGLLLAVGMSVLGLLRRLARPSLSELGRVGTHDFVDCTVHPDARKTAGLLVIRPNAPLFFGNAEPILSAIAKRVRADHAKAIVLSLEETDDLDSSSFEALSDFVEGLRVQGRDLVLARVHDRVKALLVRGGLGALAASATYSVDDAVHSVGFDEANSSTGARSQNKEGARG